MPALILVGAFLLMTALYPAFVYDVSAGERLSNLNTLLLHLNGLLTATALLVAVARRLTALAVVEFFHWVFFYVAPREQIITGWDRIFAEQHLVEITFVSLIVYHIVFLFVTLSRPPQVQPAPARTFAPNGWLWLVLFACLAIELVLLAMLGGALFSTREAAAQAYGRFLSFTPLALIVLLFLRPFAFLFPFFLLRAAWSSHRLGLERPPLALLLVAFVAVLLGLLLHNPTINPRFYTGALLVGVVVTIIGARNVGMVLVVLFLGVLAAPFFNAFRNEYTMANADQQIGLSILSHFDFDALSNFVYVVHYTEEVGFIWFKNFLTAGLFFVPNEIWTGKLPPTGAFVMEAIGSDFRPGWPALSASPMVSEGYIAGGIVGVVLAALVFGLFVRWLDGAPARVPAGAAPLYAQACCLGIAPVLLFFLSRGTLLATVAYTTGILLAAWFAGRALSRAASVNENATTLARPPLGARWARGVNVSRGDGASGAG